MQYVGLILRLAKKNQGLEFWQTINSTIMLSESVPADCLVKIAERNLDDTEAELLHKKRHEQRELPRVIVMDDTAVKVGQDSVRKERVSMRLKPDIDQRFDGIATEAFAQDQNRQAPIFCFGDSKDGTMTIDTENANSQLDDP